MSYDAFVLYNIFGREKLDRWEGIKWIRQFKPEALIIAMIHKRFFGRKDAPRKSSFARLPRQDPLQDRKRGGIRRVHSIVRGMHRAKIPPFAVRRV